MSLTDFTSWRSKSAFFQGCDATRNASDKCFTNPNRYWKGKIYKLAIYCNEIPKDVVLGASVSNIIQNSTFDIDLNVRTTPNRLRAQEIYSRIAGVKTPITNPVLSEMESLLNGGDSVGAAGKAVEDPSFLNITVRDFASKMSNRDETINVPLNDFTATIIGFVRDNISAQKLLTSDIVYQADPSKAAVPSDDVDDILRSNNHYEALSTGRYDLSKVLIQSKQKLYNGKSSIINPYSAGLLTTRQWMSAHAIAGTNRRLVEFSLREFACRPIDTVADASGPDNVVGMDIDRFPGGSHTKFTTTCRACHTIMDGFRPAFARWTFSNSFTKNALVVAKIPDTDDETTSLGMKMSADKIAYKMNQNSTVFPEGRVVVDENWVNNANRGSNAISFKWTKLSGQGTKEFGQALVEAKTFPRCMAERVFKQVCKRAPANSDDDMLTKVSAEFASPEKAYSLKYLFQRIVTTDECLGGPQ